MVAARARKGAASIAPIEILHATESMAAGVLHALIGYANLQAAAGHSVTVHYVRRSDSPSEEELRELFDSSIDLHESSGRTETARLVKLALSVSLRARKRTPIVHVHSSKAGMVVRIAAMLLGFKRRTVYSPHGFAFLRDDIGRLPQKVIKAAERFLSRGCYGLVLVSDSEWEHAQMVRGKSVTFVVENGVDLASLESSGRPADTAKQRAKVVTVARVTKQKAPEVFAQLASKFSDVADFMWIGDGESPELLDRLDTANVSLTGWMNRPATLELLASSDVFVLMSRWEGMSLALIEAQCLGIPAIVSDVVGNRDVVRDGVTGFVCSDVDDAEMRLEALLTDRELRRRLGHNALESRARFDITQTAHRLFAVYSATLLAAGEREAGRAR